MVKQKFNIEPPPFMTRVHGLPVVFPDTTVIEKSWVGVSREIGRQRVAQYKATELGIIDMKRKNIIKLRIIRKELKELTKAL